jgi:TolB protein
MATARTFASLICLSLVALAALAGATEDETGVASCHRGDGGNLNSRGGTVSAHGRYVAFWSAASNLSSLDENVAHNVFVRDLRNNRTILVSRQSAADGGAGADRTSEDPALSAGGRYVAFRSFARNLSRADRKGPPGYAIRDVFLRDLKANRTMLVSRQSASGGGAGANGDSQNPAVSADGRYVAFESHANNLSRLDNNRQVNVFVRDLKAHRTILVSRQSSSDGAAGADGSSFAPALSADGRYVAFVSAAPNLSGVDDNRARNVFVRDLHTNETVLVSRQSVVDGGAVANGDSYRAALSADGRYVAFKSDARNLSGADDDNAADVFVRDMHTHTVVLVSRQSASDGGAGADRDSFYPAVSADGRYVAFQSDADNLSKDDNDSVADVYLRDLKTDRTILVSRQSAAEGGAAGDRDSKVPSPSAHGRYVAFWSYARNLSRVDCGGEIGDPIADVFVRDLKTNRTTLASRQSATPR